VGPRPISAESPSIVAFGNSLTAGLGVSPDQSYPARLQRTLDAAGYVYRVVNAGVSGDTTAGGVRRVSWVLKSKPAIVILELGGNDGLRGLSLSETKDNLERIIQQLQQASVTVVLAGMKLPPNYGKDYTNGFESLYQALAKQYRLTLIPFFLDGVAGSSSLNQADGIHPTGEGYRIIVEKILPTLEPLLERNR
jgi:acyl-CoA thioesterase-1